MEYFFKRFAGSGTESHTSSSLMKKKVNYKSDSELTLSFEGFCKMIHDLGFGFDQS